MIELTTLALAIIITLSALMGAVIFIVCFAFFARAIDRDTPHLDNEES